MYVNNINYIVYLELENCKKNFFLPQKHGKLPYKAQLQSSGVPFISVNEIQVVKKTASGPVSGSVFEAMWNKPNGEQVHV